jgi:hypothetical protein
LDFSVDGQRFTLINDTKALTRNGVTYAPASFRAELLPQPEKGLQTTKIQFSNVAADGTASELGELTFRSLQDILGQMVIIRRVFRQIPENAIIETPLEILGVSITPKAVTVSAGFYNLYQQTLPRLHYDDRTAPGLA